jgi:WD40 repeat protein
LPAEHSGNSLRADLLEGALQRAGADVAGSLSAGQRLRLALKASVEPQVYQAGGPIITFDLSDDGSVLAIAQRDQIEVYDVARHALIERLVSKGTLARITLNSDGSLLFVGHSDRLPEIWRVRPAEVFWYAPKSLYKSGSDAVMSSDGHHVAMLDPFGVLRIFSIPGGQVITSPNPARIVDYCPEMADRLAFGPGGKRVVGFGVQGSLWMWNADGQMLLNADAHNARIQCFAFSPDGHWLATYTAGRLVTWDLESAKMAEQFGPSLQLPAAKKVVGVATGSEGQPLVVAYADGAALFHRVPKPNEGDRTIHSASNAISSIASVQGNRFIAAGKGTVDLLSATGMLIRQFEIPDRVTQLSVAGSGRAIVAGKIDSDVQVHVWDIDAMLLYATTSISDAKVRTLAKQRLKELSVKAPPAPILEGASTTRSPGTPR